ncbi:hypothetical protein FLL57_12055 [Rhodopseudomonas palustris]|uniref:hypothetical protein n=1 Tax=Rhodopseudomonas palustris TaxID=1076 RepID=UPI00115DAD03|nr:hypothetical protein [Rhodopseudomonas palustris]QDL98001.1 hypothetical protein FLL57_12055 [Rhodopseudomonas palustris]
MSYPAMLLAVMSVGGLVSDSDVVRSPSADQTSTFRLANEVYVQQPHGMLPPLATRAGEIPKLSPESGLVAPKTTPGGLKPATAKKGSPELGGSPAPAGSSGQVSCDPSNSSSQACYSATQQARPPTR